MKVNQKQIAHIGYDNNKPLGFWRAFFSATCPCCKKGPIFADKLYGKNAKRMHYHCKTCGLAFGGEPRFYFIFMCVGQLMFFTEISIIVLLIYTIFYAHTPWIYLGTLICACFFISPINYRFSRVILLYWLTRREKLQYNKN